MSTRPKIRIRKIRLSSTQIILLSFLGAILTGALLLMLPFATAPGNHTPFLTALFTSTTSICVTGLVVVDTYAHWSFFGKWIILLLIQIGGFGVITIWAGFMLILRQQIGLESRLIIRDYYNLDSTRGLIRFLRKVVRGTLIAEGIGAFLYCLRLIPQYGFAGGVWRSVFTSVSAFCNAGIDLFGPDSLIPYRTDIPMNVITMLLIIFGGLGYIVWFDVINTFLKCRRKGFGFAVFRSRLHEHTRLVIRLTLLLIVSGAVIVFVGEFRNPETIGSLGTGGKILVSLFQSVTFRTAGFATVPQQNLTPFTAIAGLFYMFVGGSPAGTAGGVKTVTIAVIFLNVAAYIRGSNETVINGKKISHQMISRATAIVTVSLSMTIFLTMLLVLAENVPPLPAAYEIFSATATVGLSQGLTSSLGTAGRLIVILAMYAGRIAPISMALFFIMGTDRKNSLRYPDGHFLIG